MGPRVQPLPAQGPLKFYPLFSIFSHLQLKNSSGLIFGSGSIGFHFSSSRDFSSMVLSFFCNEGKPETGFRGCSVGHDNRSPFDDNRCKEGNNATASWSEMLFSMLCFPGLVCTLESLLAANELYMLLLGPFLAKTACTGKSVPLKGVGVLMFFRSEKVQEC